MNTPHLVIERLNKRLNAKDYQLNYIGKIKPNKKLKKLEMNKHEKNYF